MKRIILGVIAGAGLITLAACGPGTPTQSPECKGYITCYEKTGGTKGSLDAAYGPTVTCWSTADTAATCTTACKSAVVSLKTGYPDAGC